MTTPVLTPADCYHVGIVVPDMEAAIKRPTATAGYTWTKPTEATLPITTADGGYEVPESAAGTHWPERDVEGLRAR